MKFKTGNIKDLSVIIVTALIIFGFSALAIFSKSSDYSLSERRALASFPAITSDDLESGRFMSDFETYTLDRFPFRDRFRTLKAFTSLYGFAQKEVNGFYTADGYLSRIEYPMAHNMITNAANKFNSIYDNNISGSDCRTYYSIIPDKNCFLAKESGRLSMDYDAFADELRSQMRFGSYIDIYSLLGKEDYYYTDQHWRQEKIVDVAKKLSESMNTPFNDRFIEKDAGVDFNGTYIGQSALPHSPEKIKYLTNDSIEGCVVTSYNTGAAKPDYMYNMIKANGKDAYEMFLSGAVSLIVIENPKAESDKELVIFRDSFGSSIAPLLTSGYSKITLVDIRYINSGMISRFVDFKSQDVLFLYSTLVLNSSSSFR